MTTQALPAAGPGKLHVQGWREQPSPNCWETSQEPTSPPEDACPSLALGESPRSCRDKFTTCVHKLTSHLCCLIEHTLTLKRGSEVPRSEMNPEPHSLQTPRTYSLNGWSRFFLSGVTSDSVTRVSNSGAAMAGLREPEQVLETGIRAQCQLWAVRPGSDQAVG